MYGKATPENFPYVNDYRNGVVAEGMKVLGFVNRYSRGIQAVQDELKESGNGEAEFNLNLGTAFLVIEQLSIYSKTEKGYGINQTDKKTDQKNDAAHQNSSQKSDQKSDQKIIELIAQNSHITIHKLSEKLGLSVSGVKKIINKLKESEKIRRIGADKGGHWEVMK